MPFTSSFESVKSNFAPYKVNDSFSNMVSKNVIPQSAPSHFAALWRTIAVVQSLPQNPGEGVMCPVPRGTTTYWTLHTMTFVRRQTGGGGSPLKLFLPITSCNQRMTSPRQPSVMTMKKSKHSCRYYSGKHAECSL